MNCASLVESPATNDVHALGEAIAALAARLHAATYELLVLLAEFDARQGWANGFLSCAHWLHWRTGIDLGAAREKVRVARALPALPMVSAHMRRGQLSYAKVRALTRVASPANERVLVNFALAGTAAHVERLVRGWRRADEAAAARQDGARHLQRQLSTWVDADGMVVIRGRLTPEAGAVVQRALEAAADRLFHEAQAAASEGGMAAEVNAGQRRADALGLLAEVALSADLDAGTTGDRYQVVVHVEAGAAVGQKEAGAGPGHVAAGAAAGREEDAVAADVAVARESEAPIESRVNRTLEPVACGPAEAPFSGGALELDHGPVDVSAETSRRLACDASVVVMTHGPDGRVLDVGRRTRTIPPSIRRALVARESACQFPACTARRCDAHHVEHWADGGSTSVDNLVRLCRRHHRAVHEGGVTVERDVCGGWVFHAADGRRIPRAPATHAYEEWTRELMQAEVAGPPVWDGTRVDLAWALDVLRAGA